MMKVMFATIWLFANGELHADPWLRFADMAACNDHRQKIMPQVSDERMLFFSACIDTAADLKVEAFHFDVINGEVTHK